MRDGGDTISTGPGISSLVKSSSSGIAVLQTLESMQQRTT